MTLVPGSEQCKRKARKQTGAREKKQVSTLDPWGGVEANPPPRRPNRKTPITTSDIVRNCSPFWDLLGPEVEVFRPGEKKNGGMMRGTFICARNARIVSAVPFVQSRFLSLFALKPVYRYYRNCFVILAEPVSVCSVQVRRNSTINHLWGPAATALTLLCRSLALHTAYLLHYIAPGTALHKFCT